MPNLIQIKRSLTAASPGSLANGDVLYIGSNATLVAIAGKRTPGTLTANQALVANSTGGLYWGTPAGGGGGSGTVTNIATGNGLTGGPITDTGTISVLANS